MTKGHQEMVREWADNAYLLLISRLIAPVAAIVLTGLIGWVVVVDRSMAENHRTGLNNERRISNLETVIADRQSWGEILARLDERTQQSEQADIRQEAIIRRIEDRLNSTDN